MGFIILFSLTMTVLTIVIGASRKHPNMGAVVVWAILIWPIGLIYVALTPAVVGVRRHLSARDRRELEMVEADELRAKAEALRFARSPGPLPIDHAAERRYSEALSRAAERIR
jgi:hypothetical protein